MNESLSPPAQANEVPESVSTADQVAELGDFLENAAIGFHWAILDQLEDGVYIVDRERRIRFWSEGARRMTGYTPEEVLGRCCADNILRHVDDAGHCYCLAGCPLAAIVIDGESRSHDLWLHHKAGHRVPIHIFAAPIRDFEGNIIGAFETFSDATEKIAAIEQVHELESQAYCDPLTQIPNRRSFEKAIERNLCELKRESINFGLIVCDIDHFKRFNDEHGHAFGDEVLKVVSRTLTGACRAYDFVARWGGEEFVILTGHGTAEKVAAIAERFRTLVEHSTIVHGGRVLSVTISLGATLARPEDTAESLFGRADELLYRSKCTGRNRATFER